MGPRSDASSKERGEWLQVGRTEANGSCFRNKRGYCARTRKQIHKGVCLLCVSAKQRAQVVCHHPTFGAHELYDWGSSACRSFGVTTWKSSRLRDQLGLRCTR